MKSSAVFLFAAGMLVVFGAWCLLVMSLQKQALYKGRASMAMSMFARVHFSEMNAPGSLWNTVYQFPKDGTERVTREELMEVESVFLRAKDPTTGELLGPETPSPVVLFCHGNSSTVHGLAVTGNLAQYQRRGMHVVLVEYRGYGSTPGAPSQDAITADMIDAYDMLCRCSLVDHTKIIFHGFSLGGGVIGSLCRWRRPAAMILESTFSSGVQIAKSAAIPSFLMSDRYRTDHSLMSYCTWPVLVIHGEQDKVLPLGNHGRVLANAVKVGHAAHKVSQDIRDMSRLVVYKHGHHMQPYSCRYWGDVLSFLRLAGCLPEGVSSTPYAIDDPTVIIPEDIEAPCMDDDDDDDEELNNSASFTGRSSSGPGGDEKLQVSLVLDAVAPSQHKTMMSSKKIRTTQFIPNSVLVPSLT